MKNDMFEHNMESEIIGEINYNTPFTFTFVYPDNRRRTFRNIASFTSMRTGCYVLVDLDRVTFVVRPTFDYVIEYPTDPTEAKSCGD